jgi:hypothetical protein
MVCSCAITNFECTCACTSTPWNYQAEETRQLEGDGEDASCSRGLGCRGACKEGRGQDVQLQSIVVQVVYEAHVQTHRHREDESMTVAHTKFDSWEDMTGGTARVGASTCGDDMHEQSGALNGHEDACADAKEMTQDNKMVGSVVQGKRLATSVEEALRDLEQAVMETRRELYYTQR